MMKFFLFQDCVGEVKILAAGRADEEFFLILDCVGEVEGGAAGPASDGADWCRAAGDAEGLGGGAVGDLGGAGSREFVKTNFLRPSNTATKFLRPSNTAMRGG